jgi:hypothetical protein
MSGTAIPPESGSSTTARPDDPQAALLELRAQLEAVQVFTNNNPELTKQYVADLNAERRQKHIHLFEARKEYARQTLESTLVREKAVIEYGLQTLKWLFLLNAGAAAAILAYIGARSSANVPFVQLINTLWPFAIGCVLIPIAGGVGYFNFMYARLLLPSREATLNFFNPASNVWPRAEGMRADETIEDFARRMGMKLRLTMFVAVGCALFSGLFFLYGLWRMLRAVGHLTGQAPG